MTTAPNPQDDGVVAQLQAMSDRAYCQYIEQLRRSECLGWEQKAKTGRFGEAELLAHTRAAELLGRHRSLAEAASMLRARQENTNG